MACVLVYFANTTCKIEGNHQKNNFWKIMNKMEIPCLCGNNRYKIIKNSISYLLKRENSSAKIIQCTKCTLARTYPIPIPAEHYNESDKGYMYMLENEALWRKFADDILAEIKPYKPVGELLDIGGGIGILVDEANKKGYQASGLEINPAAVSLGKERYKVSLFNLSVSQMCDTGRRWDVVILNHVLEHIQEPVQFLSDCRKLLREDGILYIGTPCYTGWTAIAEGKNWNNYYVDQHIWQWTPNTIGNIIKEAGLSVINIHCRKNTYYRFGGIRGKIKKRLYHLFELLGKSDQIILTAKSIDKDQK